MSVRAIDSATIAFGLISIPIKVYPTSESSKRLSFNQIHKDCGSRLKLQKYCPVHDTVVDKDDVVKGYEFAKGQYVLFSEDELKALQADASDAIEITEFIDAAQIDPLFFEKMYYLGPDKGAARAYRLLSAALVKTGRAAVAKYTARSKQHIVVLRPHAEGLVMDQLRYADEVRAFSEVPNEDADVKAAELGLAVQLIEQNASDTFELSQYRDDVRDRILELIEKKVQGEEISVTAAEEPESKIIDMMEALKASLAANDSPADERKPAKRASKKKASAKRTKSAGAK